MAGTNELEIAIRLHDDAAGRYARSAESVAESAWARPLAEGKWSPAQVTDHLVRVFEVMVQELGGGGGMQVRVRGWRQQLLRWTLMPRLLRGRPFPRGAPAPREIRPAPTVEPKEVLLARFRSHAEAFRTAVERAAAQTPGQTLTHAYFGTLSLAEGVTFCARHIEHHHRQVADVAGTPRPAG
jgi:hypothetical protein